MQRRIYLPLTEGELRELGSMDALQPGPLSAYAVTADLRRQHGGADEEELEFLAFSDAARSGPFRVVAAADVDAEMVTESGTESGAQMVASMVTERSREVDGERPLPVKALTAVRVSAPVPRRQVVSFHVADAHSPGDRQGGIPELSWYDATELDVVVHLLS